MPARKAHRLGEARMLGGLDEGDLDGRPACVMFDGFGWMPAHAYGMPLPVDEAKSVCQLGISPGGEYARPALFD